MWSTFVCSNLTKECLAFTRLCLHGAVKDNKKKKLVREKGERKKQKDSEFKVYEEHDLSKTNSKGVKQKENSRKI